MFICSTSQGEWEATEALCHSFEALLKEHKTWDEKTLFVNDEWEQTPQTTKGWGEIIAGGVINAGNALATRLSAYTDKHVQSTNPTHPKPPSDEVVSAAARANAHTAGLSETAEAAAKQWGNALHEQGKKLGAQLPDSIVKPASAAPTSDADKGELRKVAEEGWNQLTIAAKGLASAAGTVAGSVSGSAHKAVEHNFGKQADKVAQGELDKSGVDAQDGADLQMSDRLARTSARLFCPPESLRAPSCRAQTSLRASLPVRRETRLDEEVTVGLAL